MNRVLLNEVVPVTSLSAHDLKSGDFAIILSAPITQKALVGHVLLRTASEAVDLSDSGTQFAEHELYNLGVRKLAPGSVITVTVDVPQVKLTMDQRADVGRLLRVSKIDGIRRVRELTNVGLKEAKDYVDNFTDYVDKL